MNSKTQVAVATGPDRVAAVRKAFELLGGIGRWVKPGHKVLLKPNIMAPQGSPATTHVDTLKGLYLLCKEAGAAEVAVGENSVCGIPPRKAFEFKGVDTALRSLGLRVVYFDEEPWVYRKNLDNFCLKDCHVPRALDEADVWIDVPVAKTHEACLTTLGIKNLHGILPDEDKARHHRGRWEAGSSLWEKFVDILALARPTLTVCDMFQAMEGEGPAFGDLVDMGLIVASEDTVACDAVVEALMGFQKFEVPLSRIAHQRGLGNADVDRMEILGESIAQRRKIFQRAQWRPDQGSPAGIKLLVGDVCHGGCQMLLRYFIATSSAVYAKDEKEFGRVYILCGDHPPPPPEDRFILVFGDCAIYSTWHYSYRQKPKKIGPWWNPRPAYVDVPGCCPVQMAWLRSFTNLTRGYSPLLGQMDAVEVMEARQYSFAEGVPLEKNPRRWNWDPEFARRYAKEIAASRPPKYIYAENESLKGDRLQGRDPTQLDIVHPTDFKHLTTVESYNRKK